MRHSRFIVWAVLCAGLPALADPAVSDVLKAKRPPGGEWLGLYLLNKKVGYVFEDLSPIPGKLDQAEQVVELHFQAQVGNQRSERTHRESRVYETKPNGRLLSFTFEDSGDGGDRIIEGVTTAKGFSVTRKKPGQKDEHFDLPARKETIEDADPARVALLRNATVDGWATDPEDFVEYAQKTTVSKPEEKLIGGVKVKLRLAVSVSAKDHVPVETLVADGGEVVEMRMAQSLRAVAEPASVAKRLDRVEVFGLTRVVMPNVLSGDVRHVPGLVKMVVTGLPKEFQRPTARQQYRPLPGNKIEVTLKATPPSPAARARFPLKDPTGGQYLRATPVVESDHPDIKALAQRIVGSERTAYTAARLINEWVGKNLKKEYGASADQASDVLRQMKGDCTEHSLLTVALMRAAGIPARRVDGVVYLVNSDDGVPALYWHEWVEAFVGEWVQLDPTFNEPVADATHFALGEEANAEITLLMGQLKVLEATNELSRGASSTGSVKGRSHAK
jgi:hypothetical protein